MGAEGFRVYAVELGRGMFESLAAGVDFEAVGRGRLGTHLVDVCDRGVPLVRTTSRYERPASRFTTAHRGVVEAVRRVVTDDPSHDGSAPSFNNALIEIYDRAYFKMGFHSDQALDLEPGSVIALYSCYERPDRPTAQRTLVVQSKTTEAATSIALGHNSVVLFSLATNARHRHKIVLKSRPLPASDALDNRWLGLTLRQSKTFIRFDGGQPRFWDGAPLRLADADERRAFYRLRGEENRGSAFSYPRLDYTISRADLLDPGGRAATSE